MEQRSTQPDSTQHRSRQMTELEAQPLVDMVVGHGAVEFSSWVDAGLLCRRFITSDGSIDLTVRVK